MIPHNYLTVINWYLLCRHLGWGSNFVSLHGRKRNGHPCLHREYDMLWPSPPSVIQYRGLLLCQEQRWEEQQNQGKALHDRLPPAYRWPEGPRMDSSDWLDWCSHVNITISCNICMYLFIHINKYICVHGCTCIAESTHTPMYIRQGFVNPAHCDEWLNSAANATADAAQSRSDIGISGVMLSHLSPKNLTPGH